ncbi:MAG: YbaB/EbfC family nucleoid-associated protein [Candidatus Marinimicrobia bacterium]|jgi:DNA-binding YbaB/EbfC family protein|nr:YbaB/EbfC family nucleoid-associated protein [Candidatus Neomarinimicrobiota bacterium]
MFKGGMASMLQKAKQMQEDMKTAQQEIKLISCQGIAASGAVKVTLSGQYQTTSIEIDDSLLDDKNLLEDLITTAYNDASAQVKEISDEKLRSATDGINLPF